MAYIGTDIGGMSAGAGRKVTLLLAQCGKERIYRARRRAPGLLTTRGFENTLRIQAAMGGWIRTAI